MNAGGMWAINPHRPVTGRRNSPKNPLPLTSETVSREDGGLEDEDGEGHGGAGERRRGEAGEGTGGGALVLHKEMRSAAKRVFRNLTVEEDERLSPNGFTTPTGAPVSSLAALVWAMEETESGNPFQRAKWWGFRSRRCYPAGPEEFVVGAVMAIPTPGMRWVPIPIEDSEEEMESEMEEPEMMLDLGESSGGGRKKQKAQLPRRSPRFLRRSPRLLSLSKSAPAE
ncbi:hypothetical protein VPH35_035061 [Triticum aestivum]